MIVVAVFLFLVASVAAAGADAAVDDEVQFRRRVYAARTALRGFESAIEGAFKRATDRQSAFDWGGEPIFYNGRLSFWGRFGGYLGWITCPNLSGIYVILAG